MKSLSLAALLGTTNADVFGKTQLKELAVEGLKQEFDAQVEEN